MKLRTNYLDAAKFEAQAQHLKDIDFTLFADTIPTSESDLSKINILVLQEPNEYFGLHKYAVEHKELFSAILTWDDYVLNNCFNAMFLPFGHTWFKPEQYTKPREKTYQLSHLRGMLLKTYGHSLRYEAYERRAEIKALPLKFFDVYGNRNDIEDARVGKEFVFGDSMFGLAIENVSHNGYFTEKILDCFLMKTIPIYWGCSSIGKFFNEDGIIKFENVDDLIEKVNNLDKKYYRHHLDAVNANYEAALNYVDYERNIIAMLEELFKLNGELK